MELKIYKVNPYLNSNKDPFGLTIKGKTKAYISAHTNVQKDIMKGKKIVTNKGKIEILDVSHGKGMVNAIVEIDVEDLDEKGSVEMKIYDPSTDKKKGATVELRKMSDSDYLFVEKLRDIIICMIDKYLQEENSNEKACHKRSRGQENLYTCNICDWKTRFEPALKGHMKRIHAENSDIKCPNCPFKTSSKATMMVHTRISHRETMKRQKSTYQCKRDKCESTFDSEEKLKSHIENQHVRPSTVLETESPTSSPPRKKLEEHVEDAADEVLDLDDMEIVVENELSINLQLQKKIRELEIVVKNLLEEKAENEICMSKLKRNMEELKNQPSNKEIPQHLSSVHPIHISKLKGFKMIYKTLGNGRCLENSVAVHVFENEDEGEKVKKLVTNFMADNWNNYFKNKIPLPYKETVGVGKLSKTVEIKTEEEMLTFLRSEDALFVYSNRKEVLSIASLFNINIKIFTYNGKEGWWSEVGPDPELASVAELAANVAPDLYLYHNLDSHYDLLVKDDSRLAEMGLIGRAPISTSFNCNVCDKAFQDTNQLETHILGKHSEEKADGWEKVKEKRKKNRKSIEKLLVEEDEEKKFFEKELNELEDDLILFDGKSSGHRRTDPQTEAESIKDNESIKCPKCPSKLESKGLLDAHMNSSHAHAKAIECNLCDKNFQDDMELAKHMKEEHEKENFQEWNCDSCPFQANEAEELMNHLKATTHQPSPVIDKKILYREYTRCYTCDLEVDGYVNLMNHRK